ncbi:MAG: AAA family ATPase [Chloroflexales bacterium]|nr:AAA family ATPase [Chloroflexales bacterium]
MSARADAAARASAPRPNLLLLVGPKGSGKSFIGELLERELGVPYVRPEAVVLQLRASGRVPTVAESLGAIVAATEAQARAAQALTLDTTGAFDDLDTYLQALARFSRVRLVQVYAPPEMCLARIRARDQSAHIPVQEELIGQINARSLALRLPYELVIDNEPFAPPAQIIAAVRGLLALSPAGGPAGPSM